ncbi:MAG: methyltransferase domain-containing protein [Clostridia bacterium]|nr:methyltransferase domain-containing protein [Clostridia bacterium]
MIVPENVLAITHHFAEKAVSQGDTVIDATMGNGHDTLFLSRLVGENGKVYAFDIQKQAVESTAALLEKEGVTNAELILSGHQNMEQYVDGEVSAVMFNLGYLPGGDHSVGTLADTTIAALESAMRLIKKNGVITIGVYYGGDSGFDEKNSVMEYIAGIDFKKFTLLTLDYKNRPNCPPIAVIIEKL